MSRPRKSFTILLPLFSVLLTLLLAELAFSLLAPVPFSLERNMYYEPDPYTGFRHRANSAGQYLNDVPAIANSRGQRDDEVAVPKPDGVFRILLVGDSFTAGANVAQDQAYPQVLERILNAGKAGNSKIEVVNAGTGGWAPFQYAQFVEQYGAEFEPDLVLVAMFVGNDSYVDVFSVDDTLTAVLGRRVSRETGSGTLSAVKVWFYEHSHIARLLLTQGNTQQFSFARRDCSDFVPYFLGVQSSRLPNHAAQPAPGALDILAANVAQLARVRAWADERGLASLVLVIPDENQINPQLQARLFEEYDAADYDFEQPQAALEPLFALHAIDWLDLRPGILADGRCLYMNDSHWNAAGHEAVAHIVADELRARGLLPGK